MRPDPSRAGFTLLHLILALLGISLIAALAVPRYFARGPVILENGAVLLAKDLRTAQNRAAYSGETLFMRFFEDGDGYEVVTSAGEAVIDPRSGRPFVRRYSTDAVFRGVALADVRAGDDKTLVLTRFGEVSHAMWVRMTFEDDVRIVRSERGSGLVTIEGSTSGFVDDGY